MCIEQLALARYLSEQVRQRRLTLAVLRPFAGQLLAMMSAFGKDEEVFQAHETLDLLTRNYRAMRAHYLDLAQRDHDAGIFVLELPRSFWQSKGYAGSSLPLFLYAKSTRQDRHALFGDAVAIVGSRKPTDYGLCVTRLIGRSLAGAGITVISGGALGIDRAAHEAALSVSGATAAVLAHGLDMVYPAGHKHLFREIAANGWLLSEYPSGVKPSRSHFPARNRIVAGLADCLVVTQARPQSGTLITASYAADQGKPVFAVPGSILEDAAGSCHLLIQEGANLLHTIADLGSVFPQLSGAVDWLR